MRGMPLIELEHVTHDYGAVRALADVSLSVEAGAVGLIGQNGAGKSTLLKILLGLIRPTRGRGTVLGLDIHRDGPELRGRVGFSGVPSGRRPTSSEMPAPQNGHDGEPSRPASASRTSA